MAFADTPSGRINPKSLGATFVINGALIAAIATLMPGGVAELETITHIITIPTQPPPPKPPEAPQTKDTKEVKTSDIPHVTAPPSTGTGPTNDNGTQAVTSGGDIVLPGEGTGTTIIDPPPLMPHDMIRTGAKLDPRFAAYLQPSYPRGALHDGAEGSAVVRVLVGANGRVKEVVLIRADRPDFFEATRDQALRKWRFTPATEDGVAIESWREMTVRFEMPEGA